MPRLLIIGLSLILTLILGMILLWPKYQELKILTFQVQEKETELQYRQDYLSQLSQISSEFKNYQKELAIIDSALPPEPSLPSLFDHLLKQASSAGLILKKIKLGSISQAKTSTVSLDEKMGQEIQTVIEERYKEIEVDLELSGLYPAFKDFLLNLEKSARLIEIESFSYSSKKIEKEELTKETPLLFEIRIITHSY